MSYLVALLAGVLSVLAFSPFEWWYLLAPAFMLLFLVWYQAGAFKAFRLGFVFGLGQFGAGVSWVYVSIQTFGGMPPMIAGLCVFGLVVWLALFPAFAGLLQGLLSRFGFLTRVGVLMPISYLVFEWLRGWLFSGLPWLSTGYAMLPTSLSGLAPVGGVYLVGLATLVSIGVLMATIRDTNGRTVFALVLVCAGWIGSVALDLQPWSVTAGDPIRVALIQNNVPLADKWKQERRLQIITDYVESSARHGDKDLVVWPEGAIPDYLENLPPEFWRALRQHPADFVFGTLHRPTKNGSYYNTVVSVGAQTMMYSKQHLVPFGEFFPFQELLAPVLQYLTMPMADFSGWQTAQQPLQVAGTSAATSICYEDAFPHEWRQQVPNAGFLLNVSEDMWFGNSLAPHQRLQMAQFRSRESERPMVRSSNNGLSSLISWQGEVYNVAPQFERAVVEGEVQPRHGVTPFIRFGDLPALIAGFVLLICGLLFGRRALR